MVSIPSTGRIILTEIKGSLSLKAGFPESLPGLKSLGMLRNKKIFLIFTSPFYTQEESIKPFVRGQGGG